MEVILIATLTADGFIARTPNQSSISWTSLADKKFYQQTMKSVSAVIVSRPTLATIKRFPAHLTVVAYTTSPAKVELPPDSQNQLMITNQTPDMVLAQLRAKQHQRVAIIGGSSIYTMFMQAQVVDKIFLTIHATFFGQGISLFSQALPDNFLTNYKITTTEQLDAQTVLITLEKAT